MAPRKSTTRKKRSTRGKASGQSKTAILTLGAIVALGATALWATSQSKSPATSVANLAQSVIGQQPTSRSQPAPKHAAVRIEPQPERAARPQHSQQPEKPEKILRPQRPVTAMATPVSRPMAKPDSRSENPQAKAQAFAAPRLERKPQHQQLPVIPQQSVAVPRAEDNSRHASGAFTTPKAIIAKHALTIRETAWEKAKIMGRVEKGREMRSYAKVGRWHRVVVPSTNIIGWVEEDQLLFKNQQAQPAPQRMATSSQRPLTTGSVQPKTPAKNTAHPHTDTAAKRNTGLVPPVYPQQPVGR